MSLPDTRQISHGRTHSASWDALDYACPVKGVRTVFPARKVFIVVVSTLLTLYAIGAVVAAFARLA